MQKITMVHGSGGKAQLELIESIILSEFKNPILSNLDDSGVFPSPSKRISMSSDSFVIDPIFFPGGDIGKLAVCGTINDIACGGAKPLYLTLSLIIEEGFSLDDLKKIVKSAAETAKNAGVMIIAGDTKVVNKGKCDKIFINTAGIGAVYEKADISSKNAKIGDGIILTGNIGDHGISVMTKRENLFTEGEILSDCAPLHEMVMNLMEEMPEKIHVLRDPTRGGVASALNEIALSSNVGITIDEEKIPLNPTVLNVSEMLGLDVYSIANEGKLLIFVENGFEDRALSIVKSSRFGENAKIIGKVGTEKKGKVVLNTMVGGKRFLDMPYGENLPRIC